VKPIAVIILPVALLCGILPPVYGQVCDSLQRSTSGDLVSFLSRVSPDETNAECVTWAINRLGARRYQPSAAILVKYLDFHRPFSANEKLGIHLHLQGIGDVYPAVDALTLIGATALPTVLRAIEDTATSDKARQNAVFVWMEIYRQSDEHPKGVALLTQEQMKIKDDATKERLRWAVSTAVTWCNPPEEMACRQAAETGTP
jgi:hypothetical protein